jgi:hypothetical protein
MVVPCGCPVKGPVVRVVGGAEVAVVALVCGTGG